MTPAAIITAVSNSLASRPDLGEELCRLAHPHIAHIPTERVQACSSCGHWPVPGGICPLCGTSHTFTVSEGNARLVATMAAADRGM